MSTDPTSKKVGPVTIILAIVGGLVLVVSFGVMGRDALSLGGGQDFLFGISDRIEGGIDDAMDGSSPTDWRDSDEQRTVANGPAAASADADGAYRFASTDVSALEVDADDARVDVTTGAGPDFEVRIAGPDAELWQVRLERNDLKVDAPSGAGSSAEAEVTIVVPKAARERAINLDVSIDAGELTAEGVYGRVDAEIGSGSATINGSAVSVEGDVTSGTLSLTIDQVRRASLDVESGALNADFTGSDIRTLEVDARTGVLTATLPPETYAVRSTSPLTSVTNGLKTSDASKRIIDVEVGTAKVTLTPAR